jgi:isopropylmalate/homocitrate/citramalate synthase
MATTKTSYASAVSITITLTSLTTNTARQSAVVDNTTNLYLDALVGGSFKTATGSLATIPYVNLYAYALTDGTNYSGSASGSDAAYTLSTYKNIVLLGTVYINTANTVEYMPPRSVAASFGGTLPAKWGVIVENQTGLGLDASAPGTISYTGILSTLT